MEKIITENDYPVESNWILKIPLNFLIFTVAIIIFLSLFLIPMAIFFSEGWIIFLIVVGIVVFVMIGIGILSTIVASLSRDNFHYSIEKEFMIFRQGILTKQQKNLPYGVIQDLIISQDIADRFFGLASLSIENASFGGGQIYARGQAAGSWIGFFGNVATIPGLTKQNAEILKSILLDKVKEFPSTNKSGL
jgi:membrane protein YdbS with pleckstrin-like domain